jgi:hypothetical protein
MRWKNLPSRETPLDADHLNQWADDLVLVSETAEGYAEAAADSAAAAAAPTDAMVASLLGSSSSTRTAADSRYTRSITAERFGAVGDGVADDTAAFNAAIAYHNSVGGGDAIGVTGTTLNLGIGTYRITGSLTPITKSGFEVRGMGAGTKLLISATGTVFSWGSASSDLLVGGGMTALKVEYPSTPSSTAVVAALQNASRLDFSDVVMVNVGQLLRLGESSARFASAVHVRGLRGFVANIGRPMVDARFGAGLMMNDCQAFVGGVNAPTINRTSTMTTVSGTYAVSLANGSWDTVHMTGCFFERFDRGVSIVATSGVVINNVFITATYFDYHAYEPIWLEAQAGGFIGGVNIANTWLASWSGSAFATSGTGSIRGVTVSSPRIASAGTHGVLIGTAVRDFKLVGAQIDGVNRTNVNAMGVLILGGSHITIADTTAAYDGTWAGFPWQAYTGVYVVANVDHYTISDCDLDGTAGGLTVEANTSGSKNRRASGNRGNVTSGYSALTTPTSTTALTNTTPFVWDVSIHGGTVTGIAKNGQTITGMTSGPLRIGPGESFTLTYSSAPTVTRFVQA